MSGGLSIRILFYLYRARRPNRVLCGRRPTFKRHIWCQFRAMWVLRLNHVLIHSSLLLGFLCRHDVDANVFADNFELMFGIRFIGDWNAVVTQKRLGPPFSI